MNRLPPALLETDGKCRPLRLLPLVNFATPVLLALCAVLFLLNFASAAPGAATARQDQDAQANSGSEPSQDSARQVSRPLGLDFDSFNPFAMPPKRFAAQAVEPNAPLRGRPGPTRFGSFPTWSRGAFHGTANWLDQPFLADAPECVDCEFAGALDSEWKWRILPRDLIFSSFLAGVKESRISTVWFHDDSQGRLWDSTLGARVGLVRFGTGDDFPFYPQGWQLDVEAAGNPRLDLEDGRRDLVASDFRAGVPLTYGQGRYQVKFAYYHLSSHLGDEFLLRTGATRINFVRDVLVWGHSYYLNDALRAYGEVGYGVHTDGGSEPWEFQFGLDFAPACSTGFHGAPFFALNAHLREEFNFGGNFVAQAGWAWRKRRGGPLVRIGVQYYNGQSSQWQLFNTFEQQIGFGTWYDF